jgi:nucleotide-binding universal stress UspA family protein
MMRILYATDGSEGALAAARLLAALPLDPGSTITVLTVTEDQDAAQAKPALSATLEALGHCTADVQAETRIGKPAEQIVRRADEDPPDLVVLGSRGLGAVARFFMGSVAERVARHAACPVLIARRVTDKVRTVILGIDGSAGAAHAAEWLQRFPLPPDCEVRIVTALPFLSADTSAAARLPRVADELRAAQVAQKQEAEDRLRQVATAFEEAGKRAVAEYRLQQPALGLVEAAEQQEADLVVVGRQGMSRIERFLMGSVSEHVLRHAPCSVLLIPEPRDAA